jgi:hypothetical protein
MLQLQMHNINMYTSIPSFHSRNVKSKYCVVRRYHTIKHNKYLISSNMINIVKNHDMADPYF